MNKQFLKFILLAGVIAFAGCDKGEKATQQETAPPAKEAAAPQEKPAMKQEALITLEATVTAINQETREVTLQDAEGESMTIIAGDEVRNLAQVEVGDKLKVEYLQTIAIQVFAPGEAEVGYRSGYRTNIARAFRSYEDEFNCHLYLLEDYSLI